MSADVREFDPQDRLPVVAGGVAVFCVQVWWWQLE